MLGTVLVFKDGTTKEEAAEALKLIAKYLDVPTFTTATVPVGVRDVRKNAVQTVERPFQFTDLIHEFVLTTVDLFGTFLKGKVAMNVYERADEIFESWVNGNLSHVAGQLVNGPHQVTAIVAKKLYQHGGEDEVDKLVANIILILAKKH